MANEPIVNDIFQEENGEEQSADSSKKYLTFVSDNLNFAIASDYVIEIINDHQITHLPRVPDFIKGIINLRGQIIPIMDARLRMNHPEGDYNRESCIIVINVETTSIGLLVDTVSQMIDIDQEQIMPPPLNHQEEYVNGISRIDDVVYLMLDCESLIQ